jgi:SPP1 family predicted phage head-tail adaptor
MRAGRLKHRLYAERQSTTQDAAGQPLETWTELFNRRCGIEPLNGREYLGRSGENADTTVRIRLRYDSTTAALKAFDRMVDRSVSPQIVYDINSPPIVVRNEKREIVLMCRQL